MKLHLGCGNRKLYGFKNIDIREEVNPDVVDDIFVLNKFKKNSANLIYACHCLEHTTKPKALTALARWYELLQINGILRISVPNIAAVCEHYIYHKDLKILHAFLWGGQKHEYDFHYHGWDVNTLTLDLKKIGFNSTRLYDWHDTEHCYMDDYSQAYLPHMDKINGKLMSLNIEAIK